MMKLCKDCKYFDEKPWASPICRHKSVSVMEPVRGEQALVYCTGARSVTGKCGPDGIYWECMVEE